MIRISQQILSPKTGITLAEMNLEISPLFVHVPFFIVNLQFEFLVHMFSNGRDMTKCQFLHNDDDAKAIAILRVFSENRRAKTYCIYFTMLPFVKLAIRARICFLRTFLVFFSRFFYI